MKVLQTNGMHTWCIAYKGVLIYLNALIKYAKQAIFLAWFLSALFEHPPIQHCNCFKIVKRASRSNDCLVEVWESSIAMVNLVNKMTDKSIYILMGFQLCIYNDNWWKYVKHTLILSQKSQWAVCEEVCLYEKTFECFVFLIKILKLSQFSYNKCHTINALFHALM